MYVWQIRMKSQESPFFTELVVLYVLTYHESILINIMKAYLSISWKHTYQYHESIHINIMKAYLSISWRHTYQYMYHESILINIMKAYLSISWKLWSPYRINVFFSTFTRILFFLVDLDRLLFHSIWNNIAFTFLCLCHRDMPVYT